MCDLLPAKVLWMLWHPDPKTMQQMLDYLKQKPKFLFSSTDCAAFGITGIDSIDLKLDIVSINDYRVAMENKCIELRFSTHLFINPASLFIFLRKGAWKIKSEFLSRKETNIIFIENTDQDFPYTLTQKEDAKYLFLLSQRNQVSLAYLSRSDFSNLTTKDLQNMYIHPQSFDHAQILLHSFCNRDYYIVGELSVLKTQLYYKDMDNAILTIENIIAKYSKILEDDALDYAVFDAYYEDGTYYKIIHIIKYILTILQNKKKSRSLLSST